MNIVKFKTPAKINLGLNVVSKREDGFHNLETIFYPINLYDTITINLDDEYKFTCNIRYLENDPKNLISKTKNLFEKEFGIKIQGHVNLQKDIPIGAGLGGGSSDAAGMIKLYNKIYALGLTNYEMERIGLKLGSDVPFFIKAHPAFAESRGELLNEIMLRITVPILIIYPNIHISTATAFKHIEPHKPIYSLRGFSNSDFNLSYLKDKLSNDFEEWVLMNYPKIYDIKQRNYNFGASLSLLSGSGSSVFAIYKDLIAAKKAQDYFSRNYFTFLHFDN